MSSNPDSRLTIAAETTGTMERSNPIVSELVLELRAPLSVSEFVRDLHGHGDSDSENEDINITPYGAYRKAKELAPRSTSPPPKPIEYWEDLAMEAERSMAALRFEDIDPPVSEETSDVASIGSSSSGDNEDGDERPLGIAAVTSVIAFPIVETRSRKIGSGATVAYVIASTAAATRLPTMCPEPEQSMALGADGELQHPEHSEEHRSSAPVPDMFQAVTETSWARLERQHAQSVGADGHPVGEGERGKGHHGRHKSQDFRYGKNSKDLGRPSTSSNNVAIEQQIITGSRPQYLRHHRSRTMGGVPEPTKHIGFDTQKMGSTPLPSGHRRTQSELVRTEFPQQLERVSDNKWTSFKDRNNAPAYCPAATGEWVADPPEGQCSVIALERHASRGVLGKLMTFGDKLARRFKEPKDVRTDRDKGIEAREKRERRCAEAARKYEQIAGRSSGLDECFGDA